MDPRSFDSLVRSLAAPRSRRGLLGGVVVLVATARATSAQPACPPGQTQNKKGQCNCPPGHDTCPEGCFNLKTDRANCGSCGFVCKDGETCRKGECRCPAGITCSCPAGTLECNGSCVDTATDVDNCGACANPCTALRGLICVSGTCQCPPGFTDCPGRGACIPSNEVGGDCFT